MTSSNKKDASTRPAPPVAKGAPTPPSSPSPSPQDQLSKSQALPSTTRKRIPTWLRIILRVLRVLLIPVLCVAALVGGVVFGYVYMGGREYGDVWNMDTWKHLFELVFAN